MIPTSSLSSRQKGGIMFIVFHLFLSLLNMRPVAARSQTSAAAYTKMQWLELSPCASVMDTSTTRAFQDVVADFLVSSPGFVSRNVTLEVTVSSQEIVEQGSFAYKMASLFRRTYTNRAEGDPVGVSRLDIDTVVTIASPTPDKDLFDKAIEFAFVSMKSDLKQALIESQLGNQFVEPLFLENVSLRSNRSQGVNTTAILVTCAIALLILVGCVSACTWRRHKRLVKEMEEKGFIARRSASFRGSFASNPIDANADGFKCKLDGADVLPTYSYSKELDEDLNATEAISWTVDSRSFLGSDKYNMKEDKELLTTKIVEALRLNQLSEYTVPAGPLGIVLSTTRIGTVIMDVKPESEMYGTLNEGDLVVVVDDVDCMGLDSGAVADILEERADFSRRLVVASNMFIRSDMI